MHTICLYLLNECEVVSLFHEHMCFYYRKYLSLRIMGNGSPIPWSLLNSQSWVNCCHSRWNMCWGFPIWCLYFRYPGLAPKYCKTGMLVINIHMTLPRYFAVWSCSRLILTISLASTFLLHT